MAMEFPRGMGAQVEKSWKLQRMGEYREAPLEWKILRGGGGGDPAGGGYGYFLEPHFDCF